MSDKHHKPLTFLSRAQRITEPRMSVSNNLLPRTTFEADPEALALYDRYVNLRAAEQEHGRAEGRARIEAEAAKTKYLREVRDALGNGDDPKKIKNREDALLAEADASRELAREARNGLERTARDLAHRIAEIAPHLLEPSETKLTAAAETMRGALANLNAAWADYSGAWSERRILGAAALDGGVIGNYDPNASFPPDVTAALNTLTDKLNDLDRLREDEAQIKAWRDEQSRNAATNANGVSIPARVR